MHALVVDDDPIIRRILTKFLQEMGLEVTDLSTLEDARAMLFSDITFSVVFLDLHVHGQSGFEFLDWAENQKFDTPPEILLMSGSLRSETEERRLTAGDYLFLNKADISRDKVKSYLQALDIL